MDININSVHFDTDSKLEEFIQKKVSKIVGRHEEVINVDVVLKLDGTQSSDNKITEIKVEAKGKDFFVKKQSGTFEQATDVAVDALRRQLKKHKETR